MTPVDASGGLVLAASNGRVPYRRGRHTAVPAAGERTREILRCCSELLCSGEPHVSPDWILPYRLGAALGRKLCEVIWSLCAGSSAGQVPAVAWPVRSSLSCCLAPVRSGPAAAWSQRNQAPVGCLAPTKLRVVRPTGLHGTAFQKLLCRETGPPHNHLRPRTARPRRRAGELLGWVRAMPRYWICAGRRRCHPARVEAQNGKFVRHSRTLTTRTASAG